MTAQMLRRIATTRWHNTPDAWHGRGAHAKAASRSGLRGERTNLDAGFLAWAEMAPFLYTVTCLFMNTLMGRT